MIPCRGPISVLGSDFYFEGRQRNASGSCDVLTSAPSSEIQNILRVAELGGGASSGEEQHAADQENSSSNQDSPSAQGAEPGFAEGVEPRSAQGAEPGVFQGTDIPAAEDSDEDLYCAAEDPEEQSKDRHQAGVSRLSVSASVDLLAYSDREWKGKTTKSTLIRKGYRLVAQRFGQLCKVRGDNYCALRATLFQILIQSQSLPPRLHDMDIQSSLQADRHLIGQWRFPFGIRQPSSTQEILEQLHVYLELLRDRWTAAVQSSPAERELLVRQVFLGQEEEFGLLEAVKYLMLHTASEIHSLLQKDTQGVPDFYWLLFARDSSSSPESFFRNHLRHVGFSGGLEQVEMCLLGYSIQHSLQVYRLYKAESPDFITFYPSEQKATWPCLPLITEDDRHYNVPVE